MKTIRRETPHGDTVFCDDIRQEIGGKFSYIGVYRGAINISATLPVALPKLAMAISYAERPGESDEPVELRCYLPGDKDSKPSLRFDLPVEQMRATAPPEDPETDDQYWIVVVMAQFAPARIVKEGRIKVRAYRGDTEIRLGSIPVRVVPPEEEAPESDLAKKPAKKTSRRSKTKVAGAGTPAKRSARRTRKTENDKST